MLQMNQTLIQKQMGAFAASDLVSRATCDAARFATLPSVVTAIAEAASHRQQLLAVTTAYTGIAQVVHEAMHALASVCTPGLQHLTDQSAGIGVAWAAAMAEQRRSTDLLAQATAAATSVTPSVQGLLRQMASANAAIAESHCRLALADNALLLVVPPRLAILAARPTTVLSELSEALQEEDVRNGGDGLETPTAAVAVGAATVGTAIVQRAAVTVIERLLPDEWEPDAEDGDLPPCNMGHLAALEVQIMIQRDPTLAHDPCLYQNLKSVRLARLSASVVNGVRKCNSLWDGDGKLFTYTDRSVEALLTLTQHFDVTPDAFCRLVRDLYIVAYEAAGGDRLRFLVDGLVSDADAKVVFDIKQFRNLFCDHDLEHGSRNEIQRKKRKLAELCTAYIGRPRPRSGQDLGAIGIELLRRTNRFLRLLYGRLETRSGATTIP